MESNLYPINQFPNGEPQLGRRGIFRAFGEHDDRGRLQEAMMWVLSLGDGQHDALSIAERSCVEYSVVVRAIELLESHGIVNTRHEPSTRDTFLSQDTS